MKKYILPFLATMLLIFSCGKETSSYEKTIAEAVQSRNGKIHDLNFKVVEIGKLRTITVADSILYLQKEFESVNARDIAFAVEALKAYEMIAGTGYDPEMNRKIAEQRSRIDTLSSAMFVIPERYAAMHESEVLVSVVRCTYTIDIPARNGKITAEETFDFFLSPDGGKCYKKSKIH